MFPLPSRYSAWRTICHARHYSQIYRANEQTVSLQDLPSCLCTCAIVVRLSDLMRTFIHFLVFRKDSIAMKAAQRHSRYCWPCDHQGANKMCLRSLSGLHLRTTGVLPPSEWIFCDGKAMGMVITDLRNSRHWVGIVTLFGRFMMKPWEVYSHKAVERSWSM